MDLQRRMKVAYLEVFYVLVRLRDDTLYGLRRLRVEHYQKDADRKHTSRKQQEIFSFHLDQHIITLVPPL